MLWMSHAGTACRVHCSVAGIQVLRQVTGGLTDTLSPSAQTLTRALLEVSLSSVGESMHAELLLESLVDTHWTLAAIGRRIFQRGFPFRERQSTSSSRPLDPLLDGIVKPWYTQTL